MKSTIFATAALVAAATAKTIGSAVVVNKCTYPVYLFNTPSANGGYSEIDKTLAPNAVYTQQWTQLTNGNGWSLKLSPSTPLSSNILQYEYTFHNDGTIWYDLSEVDGNPWNGNWEITSSSATCAPKQQAYRYATDDAYGMQACPDDVTITVTLCSGESQADSAVSSIASSVAAATSTTQAKSTATTATAGTATTMITSVITSAPAAGSSTIVATVTKVATTTWSRGNRGGNNGKRDAHVHQHAARHPHVHA